MFKNYNIIIQYYNIYIAHISNIMVIIRKEINDTGKGARVHETQTTALGRAASSKGCGILGRSLYHNFSVDI